jgi:hypothetical protein
MIALRLLATAVAGSTDTRERPAEPGQTLDGAQNIRVGRVSRLEGTQPTKRKADEERIRSSVQSRPVTKLAVSGQS